MEEKLKTVPRDDLNTPQLKKKTHQKAPKKTPKKTSDELQEDLANTGVTIS